MTDLSTLQGSIVALVTPFTPADELDYPALDRLLEWHLASGTAGVVVCGTTGETPTLSEAEYQNLITHTVERLQGRIPVIAGVGSNSTQHTLHNLDVATSSGADGALVVSPYYNKPSDRGLLEHFTRVADHSELPLLLYNVPGRTGRNLAVDVVLELARHPRIWGIKEASGDLGQVMQLLQHRPAGFRVFCGDDAMAMAMVLLGAEGCISVVANQIPGEFAALMQAASRGDLTQSRQLHYRYLRLMELNFLEANPIPVKSALALMGWLDERYRLPLCPPSEGHREQLSAELKNLGLLHSVTLESK